jgi:hypothetical protein
MALLAGNLHKKETQRGKSSGKAENGAIHMVRVDGQQNEKTGGNSNRREPNNRFHCVFIE